MRKPDRDKLAWDEVKARGIDPEHPRRYRGRILLTVRCVPKGHELANVYPTTFGPLLVPTASGLPAGRNAAKQKPPSMLRREDKAFREIFGAMVSNDLSAHLKRDLWVEQWDDEDTGTASEYIRGLGLVALEEDPDRLAFYAREGIDPNNAAHFLLCRCGQRYLFVDALREALVAKVSRISC